MVIELRREDRYARLRVTDTGIGILPDHLPRIFDRFFRGRDSEAAPRGTGLGLAIAKRIVEIHGGTIDAASEAGSGTTLCVRLRLA